MTTPTEQIYGALETAYTHFNQDLFGTKLPSALITLQRKGPKTMGYFSPERFLGRSNEKTTDEVAMNPMHFGRTLEETLATFVHEMVHLWQKHFDKPSRGGYHNKDWAKKMKEIGLQPTDTGEPGGHVTGQSIQQYPIPGGLFAVSCSKLIDEGFELVWKEAVAQFDGSGIDTPVVEQKGRVRWICPTCSAKAWGKPSLELKCAKCDLRLVRG